MADKTHNLIRTFAVVVGVVITLLTCGIGLGRVQSNVAHLDKKVEKYEDVKKEVSQIKQDMAFFKGSVSEQLKGLDATTRRIELAVNDLIRIP